MTAGGDVEHRPGAILGRMREELAGAGTLGLARWPALRAQAREAAPPRGRPIIVTGCGDSYYAAIGMRYALELASGETVLAMPAMETATLPQNLARHAVMVGVSVSGKVGRTIDAVARHAAAGGATVAVTAFADSDLGVAAGRTVETGLRGTPGPVPGTVNYLGSLLGLLALADHLAEESGGRLVADHEVEAALARVDALSNGSPGPVDEVVEGLAEPFFAVGTGADLGTASFGVAKFLEAAATVGVAQDLEEWAHEQYFATGPGTTVFVHATRPEVADRARTVAEMAARVGGRAVTVSSRSAGDGAGLGWWLGDLADVAAPLAAWVPMALTAIGYATARGRWPFGLDRADRMRTVDSNIYVAQPRRT